MSAHVFHQIYLHLVWHVKDDHPTLRPDIEAQVHQILIERCRTLRGVYQHAINGTPTHVHLAVNIEPFVCISDMVKDLKGFSSHALNELRGTRVLQWQRGYGVVSFGMRNLPWVQEYIANQKAHHAHVGYHGRLERCDEDEGELNEYSL
jgi:putative transposase